MTFSLYDATVANYLQVLGATSGFLDKSLAHFKENGVDPAEIVETRLFPDMLPFRFQVVSLAHQLARRDGGREERRVRAAVRQARSGLRRPASAGEGRAQRIVCPDAGCGSMRCSGAT